MVVYRRAVRLVKSPRLPVVASLIVSAGDLAVVSPGPLWLVVAPVKPLMFEEPASEA
jgi:hypothetical protein